MPAYSYKIPGLQKASAQVAGEVCAALERSEAGLSPESLVNASRPDDAPLHGEFEWDDRKAAENYRVAQAGGIIRNLVVTVEESAARPRAFVNIRRSGEAGNFISLDRVLQKDEWREIMMADAKREMEAFIGKYRTLEELGGIIAEMEKLIA